MKKILFALSGGVASFILMLLPLAPAQAQYYTTSYTLPYSSGSTSSNCPASASYPCLGQPGYTSQPTNYNYNSNSNYNYNSNSNSNYNYNTNSNYNYGYTQPSYYTQQPSYYYTPQMMYSNYTYMPYTYYPCPSTYYSYYW
jgi:hypothetical protein